MVTAIVFVAVCFLGILTGLLALLLLHAFMRMARRTLIHDLNSSLAVAAMGSSAGNPESINLGINSARTILNSGTPTSIPIDKFIPPICHNIKRFTGHPIETDLARGVSATAAPRHLRSCVENLIWNAVEAAQRTHEELPVTVKLTARQITICNHATPRDIQNLAQPSKTSKKGDGHGIGRHSILVACESLGWQLDYRVLDDEVITTLTWPAQKKDQQ